MADAHVDTREVAAESLRPLEPVRLTAGAWTARWILGVLLAIFAPLFVDGFSWNFSDPAYTVSVVLMVLAAQQIAVIVTSAAPRLVALTFWIYVYVWAGLAPISQMNPDAWPLPGTYSPSERSTAALLGLLGVVAWMAGYGAGRRRQPKVRVRTVDPGRVRVLAYLAAASSATFVALLGLSSVVSSRDEFSRAVTALAGGGFTQGQLLIGLIVVPPCVSLFLLLWGKNAAGWALSRGMRRLTWLLAVFALLLANPISNARFLSGSVLLALIIAASRNVHSTKFNRLLAAAIVIATIFIFPLMDVARYSDSSTTFDVRLDRQLLQHGDYDAFQQTMNGVRLVADEGNTLGAQFAGAGLFWIPRQVWDTKPEPTGFIVARHSGYEYINLSSPAWLEGYVDFSWLGPVGVGLVLGAIAARLDRAYYDRRFTLWSGIAPLYVGYQIILLRGALMSVVAFLAVWCLVVWLVTKPAGVASRQRDFN